MVICGSPKLKSGKELRGRGVPYQDIAKPDSLSWNLGDRIAQGYFKLFFDLQLQQRNPELHAAVISEPKLGIIGTYRPLDQQRVEMLTAEQRAVVQEVQGRSSQTALARVAIMPAFMALCFIALLIYFRKKGGYKPIELETDLTSKEMHTYS